MDTRSDTRRQWRKRTRRKAVKRWWRAQKSTVMTVILVAFVAMLFMLLPTQGQDKEEPLMQETRYYITDDYYYTNYADYQEAMRQRDAYYQEQMEESAREVEAMERARAEFEEAEQRRAETELKFSRAYYRYPEPFNAPPIIWYEEDLEGFQEYEIPEEYTKGGGYFPDIIQEYTWVLCKEKGIDFDKAVALIEQETGYVYDAIGEAEDSGYYQIVRKYNEDLIERLGVTDLKNPYQNILVGLTLLDWLLDEYDGSYEKALTAYNAGTDGAYRNYFSAGAYASPYAKSVLDRAERIRKEMQDATED